ncbi:hypothetical protein G6011_08330 [Alternaria panax]|uniref:Uncharacterized protein n=1 Tax=Alternaria panax TaxID=48097 RepID=A0AAD4I8J7_9PLEO|nr:hypothetical protein G6011_08330 [Alternaria panax]
MLSGECSPSLSLNESRCHLLELPRELRDDIYKSALAFDEGLSIAKGIRLHPTDLNMNAEGKGQAVILEANTLKYTCHQINDETRTFLMRVNNIFTFRSTSESDPGFDRFLEFARAFQIT